MFPAMHPILSLSIEKDAWALGFWIIRRPQPMGERAREYILLDVAPPSKLKRHSDRRPQYI